MKLSLLQSKINSIQDKYAELLSILLPKLKSSHATEALDEINIFWVRNINVVKLYLKTMFPGQNSYVFTAATYMDVDDMEHLPFLMIGEKHVLDDPLSKYSEMCNKMPVGKDLDQLYRQIGITAEDNLKLLEKVRGYILVLPLRLLSQSSTNNWLFNVGERAFVDLFDGINSLNDFFVKCNSIKDIIRYSHNDIGHLVMFSENDDFSLPFEERFKVALSETEYLIDPIKPDSYNFFIMVFGGIQQAIDIIISCIEYECIPYIRYPVSLHYISLLSESMADIEHIMLLRYKMNVSFVIYQLCDKERLATVPIDKFLKKTQEYHFNEKIFSTLNQSGINEKNFLGHKIAELVISELERFYDELAN